MPSIVDTIAESFKLKTVEVRVSENGIAVLNDSKIPELVVEVLPPDQTRAGCAGKLREYEMLGVPEVWLVSTAKRTIEVLQLKSGYFTTTALLRRGLLTPSCFPDVTIDIEKLQAL